MTGVSAPGAPTRPRRADLLALSVTLGGVVVYLGWHRSVLAGACLAVQVTGLLLLARSKDPAPARDAAAAALATATAVLLLLG